MGSVPAGYAAHAIAASSVAAVGRMPAGSQIRSSRRTSLPGTAIQPAPRREQPTLISCNAEKPCVPKNVTAERSRISRWKVADWPLAHAARSRPLQASMSPTALTSRVDAQIGRSESGAMRSFRHPWQHVIQADRWSYEAPGMCYHLRIGRFRPDTSLTSPGGCELNRARRYSRASPRQSNHRRQIVHPQDVASQRGGARSVDVAAMTHPPKLREPGWRRLGRLSGPHRLMPRWAGADG